MMRIEPNRLLAVGNRPGIFAAQEKVDRPLIVRLGKARRLADQGVEAREHFVGLRLGRDQPH